ncbi:hypothetical protein DAMDJJ_09060 [Cupriavidus necator]
MVWRSVSAALAAARASARSVASSPVAASLAACQMVWTAPAAMSFNASGKSGWSMVTRVRPRSSCQNACSTSAGVPMLPLRTRL